MGISVCICTFRRPKQLELLVGRLAGQQAPPSILEVVIVDNDPAGSGSFVLSISGCPFPIRYEIQPEKNIALTRNLSVRLARGEWLAFLDDDEAPGRDWLRRMYETAVDGAADGVLGPVVAELPPDVPDWIRQGNFFMRRRFPTGTLVPRNEYRIGNALLRAERLREIDGPFDAAYGLTGGEDGRMLNQLANRGARLVWCDEAVVIEPVEASRLSRRWILMRAYRGGQDYARHTRSGVYGPVGYFDLTLFALRALTQATIALALAIIVWPLGEYRRFNWLRKAYANLGKLTALANLHYLEYR